MKKIILLVLVVVLTISIPTLASEGNEHKIHEYVKEGYNVGYTIDMSCVLGSDFHMWSVGDGELIKGWYVAYNLEDGLYYYITQDTAIEYLNNIKE